MLAALASAIIVRKRGFMSGSPPPPRAATVNSLMMRVNTLPRLASSAPFLCLIDAHFEWPDMAKLPEILRRFYYTETGLKPCSTGGRAQFHTGGTAPFHTGGRGL